LLLEDLLTTTKRTKERELTADLRLLESERRSLESMSKVGALTKRVHVESMKNAYEAGFSKALECLTGEETLTAEVLEELKVKCWEEWGLSSAGDYDPRENKTVLEKTSSGRRGRPMGSSKKDSPKQPEKGEHLSLLPYDPEKCRARSYNLGWGAQCWRYPVDGEDVCASCLDRRDNPDRDFWGFYDENLGSEMEHSKSGKPHAWKILKQERAEKKESEKELKKNKLATKKVAREEEIARKKAEEEEIARKKAEEEEIARKKAEEEEIARKKAEEEENCEIVAEDSDQETQPMDDDKNHYDDRDMEEEFEIIDVDGFSLKWNKKTNQLLDPDDDDEMGRMVLVDGEWKPEIFD
jgi:hypothetical protein